ncbi:MAG: hypothetical protein M1818_003077 [Claussenomyces sp. TS43310]|nr:MAG: hypothetical protein M1818_003077 [Claussenomyces sp. TS43310]
MHFYLILLFLCCDSVFGAPVTRDDSINLLLLAIESALPDINGSVSDVSGLITSTEQTLATLSQTSTTQNGLSGPCKQLTVIFARGTSEPGNVGFSTGPAWFDTFLGLIGLDALAFQGVDYSASVNGFLQGGDLAGISLMASLVQQALSKCPATKVVMSGYSQGGQIVHRAAALLPSTTMSQVSAVVIFGDPDNGQPITGISSDKVKIICHAGDEICEHQDLILLPHLTYAENAKEAAAFAVKAAGLEGLLKGGGG